MSQHAIDSGGRPHAQVPAYVRFLLGVLLGVALVGIALGVPHRNFPIGIALSSVAALPAYTVDFIRPLM
ncbi:MAG TPA: hypothetical protein VIS96_12885 [Terrimicrobiaceae bacterium]